MATFDPSKYCSQSLASAATATTSEESHLSGQSRIMSSSFDPLDMCGLFTIARNSPVVPAAAVHCKDLQQLVEFDLRRHQNWHALDLFHSRVHTTLALPSTGFRGTKHV
jgi:hypothetical protein